MGSNLEAADRGASHAEWAVKITTLVDMCQQGGSIGGMRWVFAIPCVTNEDSGRLAQRLERLPYTQDAGGSNPSSPTTLCVRNDNDLYGQGENGQKRYFLQITKPVVGSFDP